MKTPSTGNFEGVYGVSAHDTLSVAMAQSNFKLSIGEADISGGSYHLINASENRYSLQIEHLHLHAVPKPEEPC